MLMLYSLSVNYSINEAIIGIMLGNIKQWLPYQWRWRYICVDCYFAMNPGREAVGIVSTQAHVFSEMVQQYNITTATNDRIYILLYVTKMCGKILCNHAPV